jgi:hypothetical protein
MWKYHSDDPRYHFIKQIHRYSGMATMVRVWRARPR